jgi:hypothetical protein
MWFGTTPDEVLVDPGFPRRFVPRAFDAIMRHGAHLLLPDKLESPKAVPVKAEDAVAISDPEAVPAELGACQDALVEARAALTEMRRQRDVLKSTLGNIASLAHAA